MLLLLLCLAADWPQWRGTNRDNVATLPGLPDRLPDKLTPRWKQPLGGGYGGISVVGNRVYVMDRRKSPEAERVLCLDGAARFADHRHVARGFEQLPHASAGRRLIVDQHDADHGAILT